MRDKDEVHLGKGILRRRLRAGAFSYTGRGSYNFDSSLQVCCNNTDGKLSEPV